MELSLLAVLGTGIIIVIAVGSFIIAALFFFATFFNKELKEIKELLNNHITDTNKKIGNLETRMDKLEIRMDKLEKGQAEIIRILLKDKK